MSDEENQEEREEIPQQEEPITGSDPPEQPTAIPVSQTDVTLQIVRHLGVLHDMIANLTATRLGPITIPPIMPSGYVVHTPTSDPGTSGGNPTADNHMGEPTAGPSNALGGTPVAGFGYIPPQYYLPQRLPLGNRPSFYNVLPGYDSVSGIKPIKISETSYPTFTGQREAALWGYINEVEHLRNTHLVPEPQLLAMLSMRSKGDGAIWFETEGRYYKTWNALREGLLRAYDSPNHVLNAEMNLRSRMQRHDET
jgi:hypothetical protein